MIDEIDTNLRNWLISIGNNQYDVSLAHPGITKTEPVVCMYLFGIENAPSHNTASRDIPINLHLSYLITVQAEDQLKAHKILGELICEAKTNSGFEIEFPALPLQFWLAFGIAPLPCFVIRMPMAHVKKAEELQIIKSPPQINVNSLRKINDF